MTRLNPYIPDWGPTNTFSKIQQYFILLWKEQLETNTPDFWQHSTADVFSLLEEIIHSLDVAEVFAPAKHHTKHLIDELTWKCSKPPWTTLGKPEANRVLSRINSGEQLSSTDLRKLCRIGISFQLDYCRTLIDIIVGIITSEKADKYRLHIMLNALLTRLIWTGVSRAHLSSMSARFIASDRQSLPYIFIAGVSPLLSQPQDYKCHVAIAGLDRFGVKEIKAESFRLTPWEALDKSNPVVERFCTLPRKPHSALVTTSRRALDASAAAQEAIEVATQLAVTAGVYLGTRSVTTTLGSALVEDIHGNYEIVHPTMMLAHVPYQALARKKRIDAAIETLERINADDAKRLGAALEFFRLGESASSSESRLVLLWVALESLFRDESKTSLEAICEAVPYISASRRVLRLVQECCRITSLSFNMSKLPSDRAELIHDPAMGKEVISERQMSRALLAKDESLDKVYRCVAKNEVFLYRIHDAANNVVAIPATYRNAVETHMKKVNWQLRRIYRRRNDIVHGGSSKFPVEQIVNHLHSYLINCIEAMLNDLSKSPVLSVVDLVLLKKLEYEQLISDLNVIPSLHEDLICGPEPKFLAGEE